jgi:hypothetical protein
MARTTDWPCTSIGRAASANEDRTSEFVRRSSKRAGLFHRFYPIRPGRHGSRFLKGYCRLGIQLSRRLLIYDTVFLH